MITKEQRNHMMAQHAVPVSSPPATGDRSSPHIPDRSMEAQKQVWNLEQEIVASLVQVDPDPPVDTTVIGDNPLFHLVRDDHHDVFSFSSKPELYGGVDVSFPIQGEDSSDTNQEAVAVYVIVDKRSMSVIYHDYEYFKLNVPYIPTYLAFREIAPLEILVHRQVERRPEITPQSILVDGNGILHPRHAGIACFLGTRTNIPTIGIGKSLFYEGGWTRETVDQSLDHFLKGVHHAIEQNPEVLGPPLAHYRGLIMKKIGEDPTSCGSSNAPFSVTPPTQHNKAGDGSIERKQILHDLAPFCNGLALPMKNDIRDVRFPVLGCALVGHGGQMTASHKPEAGTSKPIFVSVGHKISLQDAVQVTASLSLCRIPEPVRQADLYGRELMRKRSGKKS